MNYRGNGDPVENEIREALTEAERLRGLRNLYVHGRWTFPEPGAAMIYSLDPGGPTPIKGTLTTLPDLAVFVQEICDLSDVLGVIIPKVTKPRP